MNNAFLIMSVLLLAGCAATPEYNPVTSATSQTFLLNEKPISVVTAGMTQKEVHQIMGDQIIIGYIYQKPLTATEGDFNPAPEDYKSLSINNPYKTLELKTIDEVYTVEFYVHSIHQSDGVITDDEMIPLIFRRGVLIAKGWDYLKSLRLKAVS